MPGGYAIVLILMAGFAGIASLPLPSVDTLRRRLAVQGIAVSLLLVWAVTFAGPFAYRASTDVVALDVARWDNRDYFQAPWNAYGLVSSMQYLQENGQAAADGQVHVMSVSWMCQFLDLYSFDRVALSCLPRKDYDGTPGTILWESATRYARTWQPAYLMLEQNRNTLEIPDVPFAAEDLSWERLAAFQRPKDGLWVTVWRVEIDE
jgi:hypothetical protein